MRHNKNLHEERRMLDFEIDFPIILTSLRKLQVDSNYRWVRHPDCPTDRADAAAERVSGSDIATAGGQHRSRICFGQEPFSRSTHYRFSYKLDGAAITVTQSVESQVIQKTSVKSKEQPFVSFSSEV